MRPGNFIAPDELRARFDEPRLRILDARFNWIDGEEAEFEYLLSRIPGAVLARPEDVFRRIDPGAPADYRVPHRDEFQAFLRRSGIEDDSEIVVYGNDVPLGAARVWWTLRWYGLSDVRILEGGFPGWLRLNGTVDEQLLPEADRAGGVTLVDAIGSTGVTVINAEQALEYGIGGQLLDARPSDDYHGINPESELPAGHIPGAANLPARELVTSHGILKTRDEIDELLRRHRVRPGRELGVYCTTGLAAAFEIAVLDHLGISASLYVESWEGWVAHREASRNSRPAPNTPPRGGM